jgi:hypothetical protein
VSRKQRATQVGYRLVKQNARTKGGNTHTLSGVLPALTSVLLTLHVAIGGRYENQKSMG